MRSGTPHALANGEVQITFWPQAVRHVPALPSGSHSLPRLSAFFPSFSVGPSVLPTFSSHSHAPRSPLLLFFLSLVGLSFLIGEAFISLFLDPRFLHHLYHLLLPSLLIHHQVVDSFLLFFQFSGALLAQASLGGNCLLAMQPQFNLPHGIVLFRGPL